MPAHPIDCTAQDSIWLQTPALVNATNLSLMLMTRQDLQTILDNTMSLEDLLKGSPYHAQMSIFHRAFIWVNASLYQVDGTLTVSGVRKIKLMNSNTLISVQELLEGGPTDGNESISNKLLERITAWTCSGKLPPFTVHQASSVAYRLQRARHCFAAALEANMLPSGAEQNAKTMQYKQCIRDILNSMQGTLPIATMMQYGSSVETAPSPLMPPVRSRSIQMQDVSQAGESRAHSQDAYTAQPSEHTASSAVLSQLSTVSSMSAKSRCSLSRKRERSECPDADASAATCLGVEHAPSSAQISGSHRIVSSLPVWPIVPLPQLPPPSLSHARSMIHSPPPPIPGSPPLELQSGASLPQLPAPLHQSSGPPPQSSTPKPALPVKPSMPALLQLPHCSGPPPADVPLQSVPQLPASTQFPVPHQLLRPEGSGYSAPCGTTAAMCLSRLQSISSSSGSQAHSASATASQPVSAASQATTVRLHWRLGQHSHVHGHCELTAQRLSADHCPGPAEANSAERGAELLLNACHLVDLRERPSCNPPVMQLHAGTAQATNPSAGPNSTMEFVRLHTLLSCMQQGLLAFDSRQASGQHLEPTPLIIFPHQQVDIVSSCTQQEKAFELCMYAAAYPGTKHRVLAEKSRG